MHHRTAITTVEGVHTPSTGSFLNYAKKDIKQSCTQVHDPPLIVV